MVRSSGLRHRGTSTHLRSIVLIINDSPANSSICDSFESPAIISLQIISLPISPMTSYPMIIRGIDLSPAIASDVVESAISQIIACDVPGPKIIKLLFNRPAIACVIIAPMASDLLTTRGLIESIAEAINLELTVEFGAVAHHAGCL